MKIIAYLIIITVALICIIGLGLQCVMAISGLTTILHRPCPLSPQQQTAIAGAACLASLLLAMTPQRHWYYRDVPDVSPGEMCRQLRLSGSRLFRRSREALRTPAKQAKRRHSEII